MAVAVTKSGRATTEARQLPVSLGKIIGDAGFVSLCKESLAGLVDGRLPGTWETSPRWWTQVSGMSLPASSERECFKAHVLVNAILIGNLQA